MVVKVASSGAAGAAPSRSRRVRSSSRSDDARLDPVIEALRTMGRRILHRQEQEGTGDALFVELDRNRLARVFAVPSWLRDLGFMSWLVVGTFVLLGGVVWLLSLTATIVVPVITATIVAAVLSPVVGWLARHGLGRGGGAAVVLLGVVALGVLIVVLLLSGVTSQAPELQKSLQGAVGKLEGWLSDAGVSTSKAQSAGDDASASVSDAFHALLEGLGTGVSALASLAAFLSFTALSLFFLLKDGPVIRKWVEHHMGLPHDIGRTITGRTLQSLRGYFVGVTAVAVFNAVVIGLGAWILGLPEVGAIVLINFVAAYIPYLGAWSAGAFTVLIALGSEGSETALVMAIVVLLANGILQQLIQPIAYGAALGIHPLAVLIVTIAGGSLFGGIGLILAAPLTSAAVRISSDLARARASEPHADAGSPIHPDEVIPQAADADSIGSRTSS
jgi:predicted PurR-regulated permease PerM